MVKMTKIISIATLAAIALTTGAFATSPKYKANVPQALITADKVETKYLGELNYVDAFPTDATVEKAYDFLDTSRAVELFLNGTQASSMYAMLEGHVKIGFKANHTVGITEDLMNARSIWLTPQTTTPYVHAEIDVKNGPVVFEITTPAMGLLDDAFFRYVGDIVKNGKYLVVGPDYKGEIPEGYIVLKTKTYRHWLLLRIVQPGDRKKAVQAFKDGFKVYPLSDVKKPASTKFVNLSNKQYNTVHASDVTIYDELNAIIQYEPADAWDAELVGLAGSIGIKKGKEFKPDARMKKILVEAAAIGNASARSIMLKPRDSNVYFYPGKRQWFSPLAPLSGGTYDFANKGERKLDDRVGFYYYATGSTPLMVKPPVGKGSVYEIGSMDKEGNMLDGSKTYSVTLPGPIPAKDFWSFMVYDNHTRSILETDQVTGGLDSNAKGLKLNKDGSATVYFGPKEPEGHETNWVQTMPNKGYNVLLRLYGPLQPWFDKTWMPGDFELVK